MIEIKSILQSVREVPSCSACHEDWRATGGFLEDIAIRTAHRCDTCLRLVIAHLGREAAGFAAGFAAGIAHVRPGGHTAQTAGELIEKRIREHFGVEGV